MKNLLSAATVALAVALLSACSQSTLTEQASTPAASPSPSAVAVASPPATPKPKPSPSPVAVKLPSHKVVHTPLAGDSNTVRVTASAQLTREECELLIEKYKPLAKLGGQVVVEKPNPNSPWNGKILPFCVNNMDGASTSFNDFYFQ